MKKKKTPPINQHMKRNRKKEIDNILTLGWKNANNDPTNMCGCEKKNEKTTYKLTYEKKRRNRKKEVNNIFILGITGVK